jgi:hypothetical protein
MKKNFFKKITTFLLICCLLISPVCIAQSKQNQSNWFSALMYDITWFEILQDGNRLTIKDPNWYVKDMCKGVDFIKEKEWIEKISYGTVQLVDEIVDSNGKVLRVSIKVTAGWEILERQQNFYRSKVECLENRMILTKWVQQQNKDYEERIKKYK